jgi:hypothetical protein
MFCVCVGKGKPLLSVSSNCSNKDHATCKWDDLWNDGLQIKLTLIFTLARVISSKLLILLNIRCGVHSLDVMPKFKRDENFGDLIWTNKVFYATALEMFRIAKMEQDLHIKRVWKRKSFDLWITMNWRWFMANKFHHIQFSLQICIMLQTCVFQIILIRLCACSL